MRRPGGSHSVIEGLRDHYPLPKGDIPLPARRGEGLSQPEKVVGRGWLLEEGKGDPGMSNQHSLGYPRPVLQPTARAHLPYGNTCHPASQIGQEAGSPHQQVPLYAPGRARGNWGLQIHACRPYLSLSYQEWHGQHLRPVPPGIKFWRTLCVKMTSHPTYLADLVHRAASDIDYTDTSGQGSGGYVSTQTKTALTLPDR